MTIEQLSEQCVQNAKDIAALREHSKSAHKRIDENDRVIESIHKLAASVEALVLQIKMLTEGQKSQGERIGKLEKEPADKWKTLVSQVVAIVVAGLVGGAFSRFL